MRNGLSDDRLQELAGAFAQSRSHHLGDTPDSITKSELEQQAENIDLDGAGGKSKSELESELAKHADE